MVLAEMWMRSMRTACVILYRLALDAETGELYTSETGQLNIESVYRIERGANYGMESTGR